MAVELQYAWKGIDTIYGWDGTEVLAVAMPHAPVWVKDEERIGFYNDDDTYILI